jgi:hypothetical protein
MEEDYLWAWLNGLFLSICAPPVSNLLSNHQSTLDVSIIASLSRVQTPIT